MSLPIDFPLCVLTPSEIAFAADPLTRPGHEATNGMRRSLGLSGSQMRLRLSGIEMRGDSEKIMTARAFAAALEGDRQLVRIRIPDLFGIDGPWAIRTKANRKAYPSGVPFSTGAIYSTGVGHSVPTLDAAFTISAAINDRDLYVASDVEMPAGCVISIDEFCYFITGSWSEDGQQRIRINKPLHAAASAGDVISLAPVFVGFCETDRPGFEALRYGKHGSISLEFVEDLTRLVEDVG